MELSPGVMRAFNEIITKDYLLFFTGLLKEPLWLEAECERIFFFSPSTLTDCMFVSLAVTQFVVGIKACRESQDLIGNLGEKMKEGKKKKKHLLLQCCINVFEHRALIFMPWKPTSFFIFFSSLNAALWCIVSVQANGVSFFLSVLCASSPFFFSFLPFSALHFFSRHFFPFTCVCLFRPIHRYQSRCFILSVLNRVQLLL